MCTIQIIKKLRSFFERRVHCQEIAKDLTQDAIIKAINSYESDKGIKFQAWLYIIANHILADFYKRQKVRKIGLQNYLKMISEKLTFNPVNNLLLSEKKVKFIECFDKLSPLEQGIFHNKYVEQMKYSDLAKVYKEKEGAMKMKIFRIKKIVKQCMEGYMNEMQ